MCNSMWGSAFSAAKDDTNCLSPWCVAGAGRAPSRGEVEREAVPECVAPPPHPACRFWQQPNPNSYIKAVGSDAPAVSTSLMAVAAIALASVASAMLA